MTTGHDIVMVLRPSYLLMHRQANLFLALFGMIADHFLLLALLAYKVQDLTQQVSFDLNTFRVMLMQMENNRIVTKGQHPTEGWARKVTLTHKGYQIYSKLSVKLNPYKMFCCVRFK